MPISLEWTKGCQNENERKARVELVENNPRLLEVIREILRHKLHEAKKNQLKIVNYQLNSWPYKQADHIGYERALTEVIRLMETTKDDRE